MLSKNEFYTKLETLSKIKVWSVTKKASYSNFKIEGDLISFTRDFTNKNWSINIDELYKAYTNENFINTIVLRKYMSNRVYSPSLAILIEIGLVNNKGIVSK